jgi:hydroxyethylthiazole kinase-like uncharacterized protein yjeF
MQPILTAREMSMAERAAIEDLRTGEARLMELAGRETAKVMAERCLAYGDIGEASFLVVCGKGNNGGDGFVTARHLLNLGAMVDVLLLYPESELVGVNLEGLNILKAYRRFNERLRLFRSHNEALPFVAERSYTAVVDAILGTGLKLEHRTQSLGSPLREAIELVNSISERTPAVTVAIDMPSGLDATSGYCSEPAVRADLTVSMAFHKTGFFLNDGPRLSGTVLVAEISIPGFLVEPCQCMLVDERYVSGRYLLRDPSSAKHTNGKVLVIAGSAKGTSSMLGAAMLAARAAVKTGAGYVCASLPRESFAAMHAFAPEIILVHRDFDGIIEKAAWADAIVIGCGLGRAAETADLVENLLFSEAVSRKKLVLDADALHALGERNLFRRGLELHDAVLTPHAGECSRLSGQTVNEIREKPLEAARSLASSWKVNIMLKGAPTLVASPSGTVLLSNTGTEALATAGTGDVLAGMTGALAAKGIDTFNAAAAAAWIHGRAGDLAGEVSSLVSSPDVLAAVPLAIRELFETPAD